jgi:hypothetical protein
MARKDADFILEDLDAGEVSLVPKAANKRKFLLLKMEDSSAMDEEMATQFNEEIMKAELEEALATPLEDEEAIMKELIEKGGTLSPQAIQAVRGMIRLSRGLEGELPGSFMDMLRGMMGATPEAAAAGKQAGRASERDKALDRYTKTKSKKEDEEMAEEVKKDAVKEEDPQAAAAPTDSEPTAEEVAKAAAKKQEEEEEEEDEKKKKLPPFLRNKGKGKAKKSADDEGDLDLESLPDDVRAKVQGIYKSQEDLEKRNEKIRKEQEETLKELAEERDARATEKAIQKAGEDYPHLPVKSEELGPIVKLAKEHFSEKQVELFGRILKAADTAIADTKAFEESKKTTFELGGDTESALGQLNAIAKSYVEKSENGMTEAAAFAKAADDNPGLYEQYNAETRG